MPRLYIGGNIYGCGNIGDDAVLQGILGMVAGAFPTYDLTIETEGARSLSFLPASATLVDSDDLEGFSAAIQGCDGFISGGGTMIGDELGIQFPLRHNLERVVRAKRLGKAALLVGIGANRLRTASGRGAAKALAGLADAITLRDEQSLDVCKSLGARPGQTFVAADPAFTLQARESARTRAAKDRVRSLGKTIGINVVNEAWADRAGFKVAIAAACDALYSRRGYVPVFFANEVRAGRFYDSQANADVFSLLNCPYIVLEPAYYSPEEMIDLVSRFDVVLSMRMHGLIFAALAGTPFVTVSRVDKVDNFMSLWGLTASGTVDDCQPERIVADVEGTLDRWPQIEPQVAGKVSQLRTDGLASAALLSRVLHDPRSFRPKISLSSFPYLASPQNHGSLGRHLLMLLSKQMTGRELFEKVKGRLPHG